MPVSSNSMNIERLLHMLSPSAIQKSCLINVDSAMSLMLYYPSGNCWARFDMFGGGLGFVRLLWGEECEFEL